MKIAFITSVIYPSPTANRIHILAMAQAFAKEGIGVDLLCQKITNTDLASKITKIELGTSRSITSAWKYAGYLKTKQYNFWYVREPHLMLLTATFYIIRNFKLPPFIVYEVHDLPRDFFDSLSLKFLSLLKSYKIIVITKLLKEDLVKQCSVPENKIEVLPDGVDIDKFSPSREENDLFINQQLKGPLIVYTGSLFPWKGVYTLIDVARRAPDLTFWIIGGYDKDIQAVKEHSKNLLNVKIWGHVSHDKIVSFLNVADILVLPNSATYRMSERYTSPLKLFEYMAIGKPIVASRLPSIEEILEDGKNAYLVEPDNAKALELGIRRALSDTNKEVITKSALSDVVRYAWNVRVGKILQILENRI